MHKQSKNWSGVQYPLNEISSRECKKVVSDILGDIECLTDIDSTAEKAYFET